MLSFKNLYFVVGVLAIMAATATIFADAGCPDTKIKTCAVQQATSSIV